MIRVVDSLPLLGPDATVIAGPVSGTITAVRGVAGVPAQVGRAISGTEDAVVLLTPVERFDARFDVLLRRAATSGVTMLPAYCDVRYFSRYAASTPRLTPLSLTASPRTSSSPPP